LTGAAGAAKSSHGRVGAIVNRPMRRVQRISLWPTVGIELKQFSSLQYEATRPGDFYVLESMYH